jgi:hypothetical protein
MEGSMRRVFTLALAALVAAGVLSGIPAFADNHEPPRTGFEESEGEEWTTHEGELEFLAVVTEMSPRAEMKVIGETKQGRPLHLVSLGAPSPVGAGKARKQPTTLFVCTQHGNEPAGREACLITLRDLAFSDDPEVVKQLKEQTILYVPTANPDGREANSRGNSDGTDINRDHLNLETLETQAIAAVVRDWEPESVLDMHEYGPSLPVIYDDELLILWSRNLNVDQGIHDTAVELSDHLSAEAEENGYSADEYGQYEVADQDIHQSAGDQDEGIARNLNGLRHTLGILVESAVTADPRNGPGEVLSEAEVNLRRVNSQVVVIYSALRFMRERGEESARLTQGAMARKIEEGRTQGAPVYFGGADNDEPSEDEIVDPPPCGYLLSKEQAKTVGKALRLHDIRTKGQKGRVFVTMAQRSEPVIPLLLDERGTRHSVEAEPLETC